MTVFVVVLVLCILRMDSIFVCLLFFHRDAWLTVMDSGVREARIPKGRRSIRVCDWLNAVKVSLYSRAVLGKHKRVAKGIC